MPALSLQASSTRSCSFVWARNTAKQKSDGEPHSWKMETVVVADCVVVPVTDVTEVCVCTGKGRRASYGAVEHILTNFFSLAYRAQLSPPLSLARGDSLSVSRLACSAGSRASAVASRCPPRGASPLCSLLPACPFLSSPATLADLASSSAPSCRSSSPSSASSSSPPCSLVADAPACLVGSSWHPSLNQSASSACSSRLAAYLQMAWSGMSYAFSSSQSPSANK
mmetsp:Transcript_67821/g.183189  ORF Transcript_67821/g.183189 Transcript_67821/m.183189 type:complete len:225 (-) Transcript_67821:236-910(-)